MPPERVLSQAEINDIFGRLHSLRGEKEAGQKAEPYDFRRPDRIPKDQLRAIHVLHENFARSLASSLSAFLRAYVVTNLLSVEQLSFMEFSQCLPTPTCLVPLGLRPYDGNAVLELNPSLVFPVLEMLLGGSGKSNVKMNREITEIEQSVLDGFVRVVLHDLKEAWRPVASIDFSMEGHETEPLLLRVLSPTEAVIAISMEVKVGENEGMMNLGIPSIIVKMLRHKFDQQWSLRRAESTEDKQARVLRLIKPSKMRLDARLIGPTLTVEDLLKLAPGDVLQFDFAVDKPLSLLVNGKLKFRGQVVTTGRKRAFLLEEFVKAVD